LRFSLAFYLDFRVQKGEAKREHEEEEEKVDKIFFKFTIDKNHV
jgi:hypothetical protein